MTCTHDPRPTTHDPRPTHPRRLDNLFKMPWEVHLSFAFPAFSFRCWWLHSCQAPSHHILKCFTFTLVIISLFFQGCHQWFYFRGRLKRYNISFIMLWGAKYEGKRLNLITLFTWLWRWLPQVVETSVTNNSSFHNLSLARTITLYGLLIKPK